MLAGENNNPAFYRDLFFIEMRKSKRERFLIYEGDRLGFNFIGIPKFYLNYFKQKNDHLFILNIIDQ